MRQPETLPVGIVGLGLMGQSICACLLAAGHPVTAYDRNAAARGDLRHSVLSMLQELTAEGLLSDRTAPQTLDRLRVVDTPGELAGAEIVFEAVSEDPDTKRAVFAELERQVAPDTVIASNTSAIPITILQRDLAHPDRLIGMHWAEPAHLTRFMEIIAGDATDPDIGPRLHELAQRWGKEPTLVKRDVRGFVTNRIMYAMIREAFHLVETGVASVEDVDRSVRNDIGGWAGLAGPFRWMDLTGIPAYGAVMRDLLPDLCNSTEVPALMRDTVASGALGTANARGFHRYSEQGAAEWDRAFRRYSIDIRHLQQKYPDDLGNGGVDPAPDATGEDQ